MKKGIIFLAVATVATTLIYFTACKKCSNEENSGGTPPPPPIESIIERPLEPDSIRVYIDNSGSMRGYTEGENSVFINAVSDLKSLKNGEAYFWGATPKKPIGGLIGEALSKNNFSGQDTPFPAIIAQLEHEAAMSDALTFIVTDGIIGVNSKQAQYLKESLGQIKNDIRDSAKVEEGMSISVFRLQSGYRNKTNRSFYYTHKNTPVKLDSANQRPFFVIAIGKRPNIQWLLDKINSDESLATYKNASNITFGLHEHETELELSDRQAFEQKGGVMKLKKTKGTFSLKANLPECLAKDPKIEYLQNNLEVKLNDERLPLLRSAKIDEDDPQKGFFVNETTLFVIYDQVRNISTSDNVITIRLKKTIPSEWTSLWSSEDDSNIARDPMEQQRTFALSYLLNGLYEATDGGQMLIDTEVKFKK